MSLTSSGSTCPAQTVLFMFPISFYFYVTYIYSTCCGSQDTNIERNNSRIGCNQTDRSACMQTPPCNLHLKHIYFCLFCLCWIKCPQCNFLVFQFKMYVVPDSTDLEIIKRCAIQQIFISAWSFNCQC